MSLYGSMYSGVSGLHVNGMAISVIGDNIANVNTIGFKKGRASFQDMMAYAVAGIGNGGQIGRGAKVGSVESLFLQGSFVNTGNGLDLAINGKGMFVMNGTVGGQTGNFFTRDGQFQVDKDGFLVNGRGLRVQGYTADALENIDPQLGDLQFNALASPVNATGEATFSLNLDASEEIIAGGFDPADPSATSNFTTTITVHDSLGGSHDMEVYFTKTADNTWNWNAMADGTGVVSASGQLTFDTDGRLQTSVTNQSNFNFDGATPNQAIEFDFGDAIADGGTGLLGTTQFSAASSMNSQGQDGYPPGDLQTLTVDDQGMITGTFTNGQRRVLGQAALATFNNYNLKRMGGNLWGETTQSGEPSYGTAGTGSRGDISSATLEQSNVDLAAEFVSMITSQRGFQANSRTITTADQMLQEVIAIKR